MPAPLDNILNRCIKRSFDFALSSIALLTSPLWGLPVALAIKATSPGPVFFTQMRTGRHGRTFRCWKFRTMRPNEQANEQAALPDDPRITAIGRWLRRTGIDELPQCLNVLRGDMSIVGPRPHMLSMTSHYRTVVDGFDRRQRVKPGITGWAQVQGSRGSIYSAEEMGHRVRLDNWYVDNWTLGLDLRIIVLTIKNVIFKWEKKPLKTNRSSHS